MRIFNPVAIVATLAITAALASCGGKSETDSTSLKLEEAPAIKMTTSKDSILKNYPGNGVLLQVYCTTELPAESRELFELICATALRVDSVKVKELNTKNLATFLANDIVNFPGNDSAASVSDDEKEENSGLMELPFFVNLNLTPAYNKNHILTMCRSRVEHQSDYPPTEEYYNYNVKSCRVIDVADLFGDAEMPKLQAMLKSQLLKQVNDHINSHEVTEDELPAEGYWNAGNIQVNNNFSVTDAGLVWHYQPGEIAQFSKGMIHITVPFEMLTPLLLTPNPLTD